MQLKKGLTASVGRGGMKGVAFSTLSGSVPRSCEYIFTLNHNRFTLELMKKTFFFHFCDFANEMFMFLAVPQEVLEEVLSARKKKTSINIMTHCYY